MSKRKPFVLVLLAMAAIALFVASSEKVRGSDTDAVERITRLENEAVKADLAGDTSFYEKYLADDWTGGTSRGTWETKQSVLADLKDTKNNKTNSESISYLQVRADGDLAIANYRDTYDSLIHGKHVARTIISTDVFRRQGDTWKQIASHSSKVEE